MPAGDRTGPQGMGAMTGRGAGTCASGQMNNAVPGFGFGRGRRRGAGRGMGRGQGFRRFGIWEAEAPYIPPTREQQLDVLKAQSAELEADLETVRQQIGTLESEG